MRKWRSSVVLKPGVPVLHQVIFAAVDWPKVVEVQSESARFLPVDECLESVVFFFPFPAADRPKPHAKMIIHRIEGGCSLICSFSGDLEWTVTARPAVARRGTPKPEFLRDGLTRSPS